MNLSNSDNNDPLVELSPNEFIIKPVYYEQKLTEDPRIFIRKEVYKKLIKIQDKLAPYKLKIWDGWRSRATQEKTFFFIRGRIQNQ